MAIRLAGLVLVAALATVLRADDERLAPPGAVFVPSAAVLTYVEQPAVSNDLKLSRRQQAQISALRSRRQKADAEDRAAGQPAGVDEAIARSRDAIGLLGEILTPEQARRHNQIVMQHLLVRFGLVQLVQALDMAALLELGEAQQQELKAILRSAGYGGVERGIPGRPGNRGARGALAGRRPAQNPPEEATPGGRGRARGSGQQMPNSRFPRPQILDAFSNPDLVGFDGRPDRELFENANDRISALLTAEQKLRLLETLGAPLAFHPAGAPPAVLRAGTNELAFPRVPTRDASERTFGIGRTPILQRPLIPALLSQTGVRDELKLTAEMAAQLPPFSGDPGEVSRFVEEVVRNLEPAQLERLRQLALQAASWSSGPVALFEYKEVAAAIPLSEQQQTALTNVMHSDLHSIRRAVLAAVERDPRKHGELDKGTAERLEGILTREQRDRLNVLLGEPFDGTLSGAAITRGIEPRLSMRAHVAPALSYLTVPAGFLTSSRIQEALQISAERAPDFPGRSPYWIPPPGLPNLQLRSRELAVGHSRDDRLVKSLTPQQERRYTEIVLQGSIKSDGPAAVFRYRPVTEALTLSPDQEQRLLKALWDDTRRYLDIPRSELADKVSDLDKQTGATIDSILSAEQRDRLVRFLGKPADEIDGDPQTPADGTTAPLQPGPHAAPARRLLYPARHRSARELAEIVQQHFRKTPAAQAMPEPTGNNLLVAAPAAVIEEVRKFLLVHDRPLRTVIVDVMLFETPAAGDGDADTEAAQLRDGELSGPLEQVASRLEALSKQGKLTRLRQLRLETLEEHIGTLQAAREALAVASAGSLTRDGFGSPAFRTHVVGTVVSATPGINEAGQISLDLDVQDSQLYTPEDAVEFGIGPEGLVIAQAANITQMATTLTVPIGEAVPVQGLEADARNHSPEVRIVVAVRFAENVSP